jgi:hypothetical protein
MQSKARRSVRLRTVLVAALLAMSTPLVLSAQSQGGGLPATNARVTTLEAAVVDLKANLADEVAARQALLAALATETAARQAAETSLQNNMTNAINAEAATRAASDLTLQNTISPIQTHITALQGNVIAIQTQVSQGPKVVVRVHSNFNNGVSDPINSAVVACAPGEKLTGGGALSAGREILATFPLLTTDVGVGIRDGETPTAWFAENSSPVPVDATIVAYAICLQP